MRFLALLCWLLPAFAFAGEIADPRLQEPLSYQVYKPPLAEGPIPAILMLHGHGGSERSWERGGEASHNLQHLMALGTTGPHLLVTPGVGNSWYVTSGTYGPVDQVLLDRLVPEIERHYEVESWSVMGLSMGGYGALRLAFLRPGLFTHAAALSPAIYSPGKEMSETQLKLFNTAFGDPFDAWVYEKNNPFNTIPKTPPPLYLSVGDHDYFDLEEGTIELYLELKSRGIRPELRVLDAGHTWPLWRSEFEAFLRWKQNSSE